MTKVSRRRVLAGLAACSLAAAGCDRRQRTDSRRQAWGVLIDLSGTAGPDRDYYVREVASMVRELTAHKANVPIHLVGFSAFAKPLASGQAQFIAERLEDVTEAIRRWPLDARTDFGPAFSVVHDLLRTTPVEQRVLWVLSDGIPDPTGRWRTRPQHPVAVPAGMPLDDMAKARYALHWDALDEYQLAGWQRAFEAASLPAVLHLRGYVEAPRARLRPVDPVGEQRA